MVKTGQFTTRCKGDRVIALKRQKITLVGLRLERSLTSEVMPEIILAVNVTVSRNKWPF